MKKFVIAAAASLAALVALPSIASAAPGFVTTNLNVRSGPGTQYPAVTVFPAGARVEVIGCTTGPGWCDVQGGGVRGWVSASYLDLAYDNRRVRAPSYVARIGIPTVTFSIGNYWDRHYRGQGFYRDRGRYEGRPVVVRPDRPGRPVIVQPDRPGRPIVGGPGRPDRVERREDRREFRQDAREDRREFRQDMREDRREFRQERREDRRDNRAERRDDRQDPRQLRREFRQN